MVDSSEHLDLIELGGGAAAGGRSGCASSWT